MTNLVKIIEDDDLENFKKHFDLNNWKEPITQIANYAGLSEYVKEITYNDADCVKYALHCNADKIFNYLLPLVDTDKHGENYGWPLLAMAIKNQRYDYANQIINHPGFNPYRMYHTNMFLYIENHPNQKEHIEFLFNYLDKFDRWDFEGDHFLYNFNHLICHNEETFERFNNVYRKKINNHTASVLDMYENKINILGEEIFCRKYNKFIIEKLNVEQITKIIEHALTDKVYFVGLFESEHAKEGLTYLLQAPDKLRQLFDENNIMVSYLPLDCILLLIDNGVDIWKEDIAESNKGTNALDYVLYKSKGNIEDERVVYFVNKYPQEILERLESKGRNKILQSFCQQVLLENELPNNNDKKVKRKI